MNLQKAIEIKSRTGEEFLNTDPDDIDEADRLSIEAMKCVNVLRIIPDKRLNLALLGETQDFCKLCGIAHTDIECPSREGEK